jgi:acetyltransferase-like isoleucine patch superfamily enzyme
MAYYSEVELANMGFKSLGRNVKISDKASIYDHASISIGDNSRIDDFCLLSGKIEIGRYVHITPYCNIAGGTPGVFIGDYSTLAYGVHVFSQSSDYSGETMTNSTLPLEYRAEIKRAVHIEQHVIIGAGAYVLPGVTIAEGGSIGAMSLVDKSTEAWYIYFGVPARQQKPKSKNVLTLVEQFEGR